MLIRIKKRKWFQNLIERDRGRAVMGKKRLLKICILIFLFASFSLLTGCVQGVFHVTVNTNGSVDFNYKIAFPSSVSNLLAQSQENPIDQVKNAFQKEGFEVVPYQDGKNSGIEARKHVKFITELQNQNFTGGISKPGQSGQSGTAPSGSQGSAQPGVLQQNPQVTRERGILFDTYRLKTNVDLSAFNISESLKKLVGSQGDQYMQQFYDLMDFKFLLTMPIRAKESNATQVIDGGKTYQWNLVPGKNNQIMVAVVLPNLLHWLFLLGGLFLLFLFLFLQRRRNRRKPRNI